MGTPNIPKRKGAYVLNEATGRWEKVGRRLTKGTIGEQTVGFWLGQHGYMILDGPSGAGGHAGNASGFDGLAWNPKTQELLIYDNKSFKKAGNVASASAIDKNLKQNLREQIQHLERGRKGLPPAALEEADKVLRKLRATLGAVVNGACWPRGVSLAVTNAFGNSKGVSAALAKRGIRFIDVNKAAEVARPRLVNRLRTRAAAVRFREQAVDAERKALRKMMAKGVGEGAGKSITRRTGPLLDKTMPKVVGKLMLRASARKAAARVASLVPVVGWAFAAKDAWAGAEDIFRGHTARGLAGIGLAAGDVASDFLHLGDAVSGVGGTALSLGCQGGMMAGQISVEMQRLSDKLEELQREIEQRDALPDEARLRDYYEMDDEAIAELKQSLTNPEPGSEPTAADLPPPPAWGQEEELIWPDNDLPLSAPPLSAPLAPPLPGRLLPQSQPAPNPPVPPDRWTDQLIAWQWRSGSGSAQA